MVVKICHNTRRPIAFIVLIVLLKGSNFPYPDMTISTTSRNEVV